MEAIRNREYEPTFEDRQRAIDSENVVYVIETLEQKSKFLEAFTWMQKAMEGEAERAGLTSEEAIMDLVREIRYGEKSSN